MKRLNILILLVLANLSLFSQVQQYYTFSSSQESYTQLSGGNELQITGNSDLYPFIVDNSFTLFGQNIGDTLLIGTYSGGFIISYTPSLAFSLDVFLADFVPQSGKVYYEWDTLSSGPVLSFEWRNWKLRNHPTTDFVNFKVNIHTNTEVVEYHYGPSFTSATASFQYGGFGPGVYFWLLTPDFTQYYYLNAIGGNPSNPSHSQSSITNFLTGVPPTDMLYRFEPYNIGLDEREVIHAIYPNPATSRITIDRMETGEVLIISATGKVVYEGSFTNSTVDVSFLQTGLYLIKIQSSSGEFLNHTLLKK